jgi:2-octaprenyl-6-methoxyphenol hydroxylase
MIDATGSRLAIPSISFAAKEIGLKAFGANIANHDLVAHLARLAQDCADLSLHHGKMINLAFRPQFYEITLDDGRLVHAKLVIAADGRLSMARTKAGIGVRSWAYPQTALTAYVKHKKPHGSISTEFHTRNGPCTFVPMKGEALAPHRSSLVWLMSHEEALRRQNLDDVALGAELNSLTQAHLDGATPQGPRGFFPIGGMRAQKIAKPRLALIGETAHVFPPLAAQGLNLSLRDIADLLDCLEDARAARRDIGGMEALASYEKRHQSDIALRTHGIDVLNRSLLSDFLPLDFLRGAGFAAFSMLGPLRRMIMWEGVLPHGYVPRLMRPLTPGRFVASHRQSA